MDTEAIAAIKELTTNLLYLGVGVFALVGGYLTSSERKLEGTRVLLISIACFGLSLGCGLIVMMRLADQILTKDFNAKDPTLGWAAFLQVLLVGVGSLIFFVYLCMNLWSRRQ